MGDPQDERELFSSTVGEIRLSATFEPNTLIFDAGTSVPARLLAPEIAPEAATEPHAHHRIAHFRVLSTIGKGGMGVIYRANDEYLQRLVALKVIGGGHADPVDPEQTQRLLREARAASRINHPNVVTIYAAGEHEGVPFIAMEYVEGQELAKLVGPEGLDTERALDIAVQVAEGLGAAHRQGIVHRDVKPANILVCARDRVKILDFGLAKPDRLAIGERAARGVPAEAVIEGIPESADALGFYNTQAGVIWGSLRYMSPEQFSGDAVDARSDVYSLGVVVYQMLTGRLPFYAKKPREQLIAILRTEPRPLRESRLRIPDYVQAIVSTALARDPDMRYASGDAFAAELRTALARLRAFGDAEIEIASGEAPAPPAEPEAPAAASGPRHDESFAPDSVTFYPPASQFDAVVVSANSYPWSPRKPGGTTGSAVRLGDGVYEVAAIDCPRADIFRYFLVGWPANAVIRRVFDYSPAAVASHAAERRPSSGERPNPSLGTVISGLFGRRGPHRT